jgi:hypothetical protein
MKNKTFPIETFHSTVAIFQQHQRMGFTLKKIAPSEGRRENCWGISFEKSRFYAKKSYFFQF